MPTYIDMEKFLHERMEFDIPRSEVEWVRLLASELAMGVHRGHWTLAIKTYDSNSVVRVLDQNLRYFAIERWNLLDWRNAIQRLHGMEFIVNLKDEFTITRRAFDLLHEAEPYDVFISYRRRDSSALALLVSHRLQHFKLIPFVDMATKIGDNWYDELHRRIRDCEYFIILLGRNTLKSQMTQQEIKWAIEYRDKPENGDEDKKKIIPIWHGGFNVTHKRWQDVDQTVKDEISATNAIRVTDESASGYNTAIVELLNRFGITP